MKVSIGLLGAALALCVGAAVPAFAQSVPTDDIDVPEATAPPAAAAEAAATTADAAATAKPAATAAQPAKNPAPADPSLLPVYREFGELPGLTALMDDFMLRMLADPRTRPFFANADQVGIKKHLVEQFCVILGGPCSYTGRDMKTAHEGLKINRSNFNALVEDLQVSMDKRGISFRSQNKLLAKLAPMHHEVETR